MKSLLHKSIIALLAFVPLSLYSITVDYNVVPCPRMIENLDTVRCFIVNDGTRIVTTESKSMQRNGALLMQYMFGLTGRDIALSDSYVSENVICLTDTLKHTNPEAYRITVTPQRIVVDGASAAGCFYGCQTLRKAVVNPRSGAIGFPGVVIKDWPEYGYRGAHLDVARHFFPVDSVKRFIDMIALHNINTFHWHLSDDQGWRVEIKSRPLLTEVGSMRKETIVLHTDSCDGIPHGGYYTQDEIKDVIAYAADRHIRIIPEIDIPGHAQAVLASYPEVGCTGGPYEVFSKWYGSPETLCPGNDETFEVLYDIFGEIIALFPSEFINIGGDECPKARWKSCPKCQARIAELGIVGDSTRSAEDLLQGYVTERVSKFIGEKGRRVLGWDEILECDLPHNVAVMSWRGTEGALDAARRGHDAVMCPTQYCYFDYYQTSNPSQEPMAGGGYIPVDRVYSFEPKKGFTDEEAKHIIGVQCNHWSEAITNQSVLENRALPRMAALCEVQWCSSDDKDYAGFLKRLEQLRRHYDLAGYKYAPYIFQPNR